MNRVTEYAELCEIDPYIFGYGRVLSGLGYQVQRKMWDMFPFLSCILVVMFTEDLGLLTVVPVLYGYMFFCGLLQPHGRFSASY